MTRMGPLVFLFCSFISWVGEAEGQSQSPPINVNNELALGTGIDDERDAMDLCTAAAGPRLPNGVFSPGRTTYASLDDTTVTGGYCGVPITTPGIWWWMEGTGGMIRTSTCHIQTTIPVKISVFTGPSCNDLTCVTGGMEPDYECPILHVPNELEEWETLAIGVNFPTVLGQQYYILVHEQDAPPPPPTTTSTTNTTTTNATTTTLSPSGSSGDIWLNFRAPSIPQNDECVDAIGPVPRDLTRISATNVDASKSYVPVGYCGGDALPSLYPGTWFQVIGTGALVTIMACSPQNFDGYTFSVYAGDAGTCATLACTAPGTYQINGIDPNKCTFGGSPRPLTSYTFATIDRTRYYVYVHFARTRADKPTGDIRFYVDDGADGNGSSSGAHMIRYDEDGYDEHDATTTKNSTTATPTTNTNPNNNNNNNNNIDDSGNVNNGGENTPQGNNDRNPVDFDGDEGWNKLWLLMLLFIIPLCILFFCWYRTRNEYRDDGSEDSEDRDAWLDAGDAWLDDDGVEDGTRQARGTRSDASEDNWDSEDDSDDDSDIYKEDEDDSDDDSDSIYDDVVGESEESSESDEDNNEDDSTIDDEFNTEYSSSRLDGRNNN